MASLPEVGEGMASFFNAVKEGVQEFSQSALKEVQEAAKEVRAAPRARRKPPPAPRPPPLLPLPLPAQGQGGAPGRTGRPSPVPLPLAGVQRAGGFLPGPTTQGAWWAFPLSPGARWATR